MDEFGCCGPDDYVALVDGIVSAGNVVFSYSDDDVTAYVVTITTNYLKLGTMPFGGQPTHLVSILLKGCYWFDLNSRTELHESYVGEKLKLDYVDSVSIARLLNGIRKAMP